MRRAAWNARGDFPFRFPARIAYVARVNTNPEQQPPQVPVRLERYQHDAPPPPPPPRRKYWLHPISGLLILGVDWFFFPPEIIGGGITAIISSPLAFLIAGTSVFWVQRKKNGDPFGRAILKALLGGFVAAIPTSIGGTLLGTAVLVLSGLSNWSQRRGTP
jgi:hypothetical protein